MGGNGEGRRDAAKRLEDGWEAEGQKCNTFAWRKCNTILAYYAGPKNGRDSPFSI